MNVTIIERVIELLFENPRDLGERLASGEFRSWGDAAATGDLQPRILLVADPSSTNRVLLEGLQVAHQLGVLSQPESPLSYYLSLSAALGLRADSVTEVLKGLSEATKTLENR